MKDIKTSLVVTVLNEEQSINKLIDSILSQTVSPDEVIIVDGGSTDATASVISNFKFQISNKKINFPKIKLIIKKGNRAVGRNAGIKSAIGNIILSTDAGCTLDKNWVKNIIKPFTNPKIDAVAGYYRGQAKNIFQKCLIPYVLVMEDKVDPKKFLPATRSMAFKKSVWKKLGGFNERLSHNEDYEFSNKIKKKRFKIAFCKDAIVNWIPRNNLLQSFVMFFRFALGDIEANILRTKVIYLFLRYFFALYLILLNLIEKNNLLFILTISLFLFYIFWSIYKNYKYVNSHKAIFYLPLLQFTSDFAVMSGTGLGLLKKISLRSIYKVISNHKLVVMIIGIYILVELLLLPLGVPNSNHPFAYFMDEWHQSQAVRNVFKYGTPNIEGSANGSMFHFFLTGIYLIPFYFLKIIDPFSIKSSVTQLQNQHLLFEILRLNTLFFGIAAIILFTYICKKYFKLNPTLTAFLFIVNPLWVNLSNYFKYDIALMFWILLAFNFMLRYSQNSSFVNFLMAGLFSGLSLSTKLSAVPLFPIYIILFFLYTDNFKKRLENLIAGVLIYIGTFAVFGIPDILLGKGNLYEYLSSNLVRTPIETSYNILFGMHYFSFLLLKAYPVTFGHSFYYFFIFSLFLFLITFIKKINFKFSWIRINNLFFLTFLFFTFFAVSLFPLKIGANGNRVLVLLPFMVIIVLFSIDLLQKKIKNTFFKYIAILFFVFLALIQIYETASWIYIRVTPDPRIKSSTWIAENIPKNTLIGIENIPIYQFLPDIIVKEFYNTQYKKNEKTLFKYQVINSKMNKIPNVIIVTNDQIEKKYLKKSDKKELTIRLGNEGYKKIAVFKPDFTYFNLLNSEFDFYVSSLVFVPNSITIYKK